MNHRFVPDFSQLDETIYSFLVSVSDNYSINIEDLKKLILIEDQCEYTYKKGPTKGVRCKDRGKKKIEGKVYCITHSKIAERMINANDVRSRQAKDKFILDEQGEVVGKKTSKGSVST